MMLGGVVHIKKLLLSEAEKDAEIGAMALLWNYHQEYNRYQDSTGRHIIFCYGCGKPNTYKPSCVKCHKKTRKWTHSLVSRVFSTSTVDESRDTAIGISHLAPEPEADPNPRLVYNYGKDLRQ